MTLDYGIFLKKHLINAIIFKWTQTVLLDTFAASNGE
jgi:hypothetical protein